MGEKTTGSVLIEIEIISCLTGSTEFLTRIGHVDLFVCRRPSYTNSQSVAKVRKSFLTVFTEGNYHLHRGVKKVSLTDVF